MTNNVENPLLLVVGNRLYLNMEDMLNTILNEAKSNISYNEEMVRGYLILFASRVCRQAERIKAPPSKDQYAKSIINNALAYITKNLSQPDLDVVSIARHVALSPNYFINYFKKNTGHSPYRYLMMMRIEQAKQLLRSTDSTVLEISHKVGFKTPFHFSNTFKRVAGMSPSEYRAAARDKTHSVDLLAR